MGESATTLTARDSLAAHALTTSLFLIMGKMPMVVAKDASKTKVRASARVVESKISVEVK